MITRPRVVPLWLDLGAECVERPQNVCQGRSVKQDSTERGHQRELLIFILMISLFPSRWNHASCWFFSIPCRLFFYPQLYVLGSSLTNSCESYFCYKQMLNIFLAMCCCGRSVCWCVYVTHVYAGMLHCGLSTCLIVCVGVIYADLCSITRAQCMTL